VWALHSHGQDTEDSEKRFALKCEDCRDDVRLFQIRQQPEMPGQRRWKGACNVRTISDYDDVTHSNRLTTLRLP